MIKYSFRTKVPEFFAIFKEKYTVGTIKNNSLKNHTHRHTHTQAQTQTSLFYTRKINTFFLQLKIFIERVDARS